MVFKNYKMEHKILKSAIILFDLGDESIISLYREIIKFFLVDSRNKKIYIFTDRELGLKDKNLIILNQVVKKNGLLLKYVSLSKKFDCFNFYDYLYLLTPDLKINLPIGRKVLFNDFICLKHPHFNNIEKVFFPYERNNNSQAFLDSNFYNNIYYSDIFMGGRRSLIKKFIQVVSSGIEEDLKKDCFANLGEESYLNKYLAGIFPSKCLDENIVSINNANVPLSIRINRDLKTRPLREKDVNMFNFKKNTILNKNKIDLSDLTFIIPVKIDSRDRLENINLCIAYLTYNFNTNIIVFEEDHKQSLKHLEKRDIKYIYRKPLFNFFYRTQILNIMTKIANTPFICNYDCDVILSINSYVMALNKLRNREFSMIYPYDAYCKLSRKFCNNLGKVLNIDEIIKKSSLNKIFQISYGCCNLVNKNDYVNAGLENEHFKSWGPEDYERYLRMTKLGYKVGRLNDSTVYHMEHSRGPDSNKTNPNFEHNNREYEKIKEMNKDVLKRYVETWKWR